MMQMMRLKTNYLFAVLFLIFFCWTSFKLLEPSLFRRLGDFQPNDQSVLKHEHHHHNHDKINLNELFVFGECLLNEAGKKIVAIRSESDELKINHKQHDNSVVTKADIESHTIIVHTLEAKYKNRLHVVSEESNSKEAKNFDLDYYMKKCDIQRPAEKTDKYENIDDITVWIDPLDATQEYSENLTEYVTVMMCIAYKGKPKAGIIHNPFSKWTEKAFFEKKSEKLNLSDTKNRVVVSRSHSGTVITEIKSRLDKPVLITAAGSGFKTYSLLKNYADVYFHTGRIYKWDICAPNAILNSYGGKLTQRNGQKIDYSGKKNEPYSIEGIIAAAKEYDYFLKLFGNKS